MIDEPPGWRSDRDGDWTLVTSPDHEVRLLATPLTTPSGTDPRQVFERDIAPGLRVEYFGIDENRRTRYGWPITLTTLRLVDADGKEREQRIGVLYKMLMYIGVAVVRVSSPSIYERDRDAVLAMLDSARPHLWSNTTPACVAELFMEEEP